ncbi:dipeptide epimerase [Limnoglobus roseus]|uniref:Dipeptide epimerase n=1 Tax=Limnoglobus roseus TaxID=2598579 RepID=A0A5C1ADH9_9BACT|nr:dipeptide epimerase [Limnoglobus roseus]QEL16056.1 dipeptide epimerase [Limnoglobus roseus]
MRVVELEVRHVRVPLKKPIKHASHVRTETDNVVVRIKLGDGSTGYGEGVPRDYVTGETIDSVIELLRKSDLGKQLKPAADFAEAVKIAEQIQLAPVPGDDRRCQGNAARCAVELAYLDAFGRAFGEPLINVTKLLAPELYEPRKEVRYSGIIMGAKGLKARIMGWAMYLYGFRQVKVKVGIAGHNDAKRLKIIRGRVGSKMDLRVDANEAWSPGEVAAKIRELEPFGISSVEQPVRHEDVAALADVRKQVKTPIMLDESLCSMVDAERALQNGWCDLFNLRLSKCGGFIPSLRLAEFAKRNGLGYQLGCQVGETAILSGAGRMFAASVKDIRFLEGSYDKHLITKNVSLEEISFRRGGRAPMLTGSGVGVAANPVLLDAITVRKEMLIG